MVVQNLPSKDIKPLKTSLIKLLKVIFFPLFFCPQFGQNFSWPKNGCPQFRHSGSLGKASFLLLFLLISLMIRVLIVEMLV